MTLKQKVTQLAIKAGSGIYACVKVANAVDIFRWSNQVLGNQEEPEELHCSVCFSTSYFNTTNLRFPTHIKLPANNNRRLGRLGDGGAVVLFLADDEQEELQAIWQKFMSAGASFDFPSFIPHITVAYDSELTTETIEALDAYSGPIVFSYPEIKPLKPKGETAASASVRLAILNGKITKAKFVSNRWLIGGDFLQSGDRVSIAYYDYLKDAWCWGRLKGNRLVFDDMMDDREVEAQQKLNSETSAAPRAKPFKLKQLVRAIHPKTDKWTWGIVTKIGITKATVAWEDNSKPNTVYFENIKLPTTIQLAKHNANNRIGKKKTNAPVTKRSALIDEIKDWVKKYNSVSSDKAAEKYKIKIYEALEKNNIKREEVGLKPLKKTATPIPKKPIQKPLTKEIEKPIDNPSIPNGTTPNYVNPLKPSYFKLAQNGNNKDKLNYMELLWKALNKSKFDGQMKMPNIGLQKKVSVDRMRRRGVWYQGSRRLEMSPHIFNNEDKFYEIFLHEMCHQAVSEITKLKVMEPNQGHGPVWSGWMRKVGLDPSRYDTSGNSAYMTEEQLATKAIQTEVRQRAISQEKQILPRHGLVAKWHDPKTGAWFEGIIVAPSDKAGKRWAFASYPARGSLNTWKIIPSNWFYEVPEERHEMIVQNLKHNVEVIRNATQQTMLRRSNARRKDNWY